MIESGSKFSSVKVVFINGANKSTSQLGRSKSFLHEKKVLIIKQNANIFLNLNIPRKISHFEQLAKQQSINGQH